MWINKLNNIYDKNKFNINTSVDKDTSNFSELMYNKLKDVNKIQIQADELREDLALGKIDNLHNLTIAGEKANVALQISMGIRSKLVEAYKEIMRLQI